MKIPGVMNPNKTYIAFDADGVRDAENSNLRTFNMMAEWQKRYPNHYNFINIDSINFSSQHDDTVEDTRKQAFFRLLDGADNLLVVITRHTNPDSKWLNWQISRAVNRYHLPVIVAFDGIGCVTDDTIKEMWDKLPVKIRKYIGRDSARMCYIPFTQTKVEMALHYFSVRSQTYAWNSTTVY